MGLDFEKTVSRGRIPSRNNRLPEMRMFECHFFPASCHARASGHPARRPHQKCAAGMSAYPLGGEQQSRKCVRLNVESFGVAAKAEPQRVPLAHEVGGSG